MDQRNSDVSVTFGNTQRHCPIGEITGKKMMAEAQTPVISCEGSCIRGEIARLAANMLAKEAGYGRGCHGEFMSVPQSAMAKWAHQSDRIVIIDGCFLHCHGRMMKGLFNEDRLAIFDALSYYGKYTDIMDIDEVPEKERSETAKAVFNKVREALLEGLPAAGDGTSNPCSSGCENEQAPAGCCGS